MKASVSHSWDLTPKQASQLQLELRSRLRRKKDFDQIRTVAGADVALSASGRFAQRQREVTGYAGVIVYSFPALQEIERQSAQRVVTFPYVPGLLVFREGPALLDAFAKLRTEPDLLMFDAHGYSHPRRFGLACHLSVVLDRPGIGVAKSILVGRHHPPPERPGAWTPLVDAEETVGAALRTRQGVHPVYISIGHRIDLESAIELALACTDGTRIPKPTREADHFVEAVKRGQPSSTPAPKSQSSLF